MKKLGVLVNCLIILLFILGCDEDSIVNNYTISEATIAGRVLPESSATIVSLWMGTEVASRNTDSRGYFTFKDVEPGLYEVRITGVSGASTRRFNIIAETGKTTNLGEITLKNVVWPILWVIPEDSLESVVPSKTVVRFGSKDKIDMTSLISSISITPQISGVWKNHLHRKVTNIYLLETMNYPSMKYTWFCLMPTSDSLMVIPSVLVFQ